MKKFKKILHHALLMIKINRKSYVLLSITIAISLGIVFEFLLFFDTRSFNNHKEAIRYPDNIGELNETGNTIDDLQQFCTQIDAMKDTAIERWKKTTMELTSYSGINGDKSVHVNAYLTKRNFFNYPFFVDKFEKVELIEGRIYSQEEIVNKANVVVIDAALANAYSKENVINEYLTLPILNEDGSFHLEDYRIIGVVSKREDTITVIESDGFEIDQSDIYLPITQSDRLFTQQSLSTSFTIISNQLEEITYQAAVSGIKINSSYTYKKLMHEDMQDAIFVKAIILILIVFILEINMFSTLRSMIKDREKEIGIKRALGISNRDIIIQFLIEMFLVLIMNVVIISALCTSISYVLILLYNDIQTASLILYIQPYSLVLFFIISFFLIIGNSLLTSYLTMKVDIIQNIKAE